MKKLFLTHSTPVLRLVLMLFVLGYSVTANAQLKFTATDTQLIPSSTTQWQYKTVECSPADVRVTSITISMINNRIVGNNSGINSSGTLTSQGKDPYTITYLFGQPLSATQVARFIKGFTFDKTNDVPNKTQHMRISVDTNPTSLPPGSNITVWKDHPDGSVHYYVWVPSPAINYNTAYTAAKRYYFQGMRGYLPTITSEAEHKVLINISQEGGWSAGARSYLSHTMDGQTANNIRPDMNYDLSKIFRWHCGPESGFEYYRGPRYSSSGAGPIKGAYNPWVAQEPNNGYTTDGMVIEWFMQINFADGARGRGWNDLPDTGAGYVNGYFIEFGGNGKEYTVGSTTYKANQKYETPTGFTNNDQWHNYNPGNTASTEATAKPRAMRSHVMVIE